MRIVNKFNVAIKQTCMNFYNSVKNGELILAYKNILVELLPMEKLNFIPTA